MIIGGAVSKTGIADLTADLPFVAGIESEIREALTNLVGNAVDAIPQGGTITLRTRLAGECPILEVVDTGIGMDEQTRLRCLDPFYTTKGKQGTGLGLAMIFGVMQRHEGEIEIDSALGQGTTMRLVFPLRESVGMGDVSPEKRVAVSSPLRILCIDDDPMLQELLREMLVRDGHAVVVADGGQAGLEAFRAALEGDEPFEVVITDLGMPHMDGRQVARAVKQESPETPVLLLTGWGTRLHAEGDIPAAVDIVLNKPPGLNQMREALNRVAG